VSRPSFEVAVAEALLGGCVSENGNEVIGLGFEADGVPELGSGTYVCVGLTLLDMNGDVVGVGRRRSEAVSMPYAEVVG